MGSRSREKLYPSEVDASFGLRHSRNPFSPETEPDAWAIEGDLARTERTELHAYAAGSAADELVSNWLDWIHESARGEGACLRSGLVEDVDDVIERLRGWRAEIAEAGPMDERITSAAQVLKRKTSIEAAVRELEDAHGEMADMAAEVAKNAQVQQLSGRNVATIPMDLLEDLQAKHKRWRDAGEALVQAQRAAASTQRPVEDRKHDPEP